MEIYIVCKKENTLLQFWSSWWLLCKIWEVPVITIIAVWFYTSWYMVLHHPLIVDGYFTILLLWMCYPAMLLPRLAPVQNCILYKWNDCACRTCHVSTWILIIIDLKYPIIIIHELSFSHIYGKYIIYIILICIPGWIFGSCTIFTHY